MIDEIVNVVDFEVRWKRRCRSTCYKSSICNRFSCLRFKQFCTRKMLGCSNAANYWLFVHHRVLEEVQLVVQEWLLDLISCAAAGDRSDLTTVSDKSVTEDIPATRARFNCKYDKIKRIVKNDTFKHRHNDDDDDNDNNDRSWKLCTFNADRNKKYATIISKWTK